MLLRKRHQFHIINMQKALAICQIHVQEVKNRITQQTAIKWWYNLNVMVTLHQYSLHRAFPSPYLGFLAILPPTVFIVHHPAPDIVSFPLCTYHCSLLPYNILFLTSAIHPASFDQPAHSSTVFIPLSSLPDIFLQSIRSATPCCPLLLRFSFIPFTNYPHLIKWQFICSSSSLLTVYGIHKTPKCGVIHLVIVIHPPCFVWFLFSWITVQ